jgi:LacI family transcriptional regulator
MKNNSYSPRPTQKQIAELLGISQGTVDRALHSRGGINRETEQLVKQTAAALNYKTNKLAHLLKTGKKLDIALVAPRDNLFAKVKEGVEAFRSYIVHDFVNATWYETKGFDTNKQIEILVSLISRGIDAIGLAPADPYQLTPWIDRAVDRNIPVVTINTDAPESKRLCYIGLDHYLAGRIAGELLGKFMKGEGKIIYISGFMDAYSQNRRLAGFESIIQESFPRMEIAGLYHNDRNTADQAYEITREALTSHGAENFGYVITSGNGAEGVVRALEEIQSNNIVPKVCFDFLPKNIELLKSGHVSAVIGEDPFSQGFQTTKCLFEHCVEKQTPPQSIHTNVSVGLMGNIDTLLIPNAIDKDPNGGYPK